MRLVSKFVSELYKPFAEAFATWSETESFEASAFVFSRNIHRKAARARVFTGGKVRL